METKFPVAQTALGDCTPVRERAGQTLGGINLDKCRSYIPNQLRLLITKMLILIGYFSTLLHLFFPYSHNSYCFFPSE